LKFFIYIFWGGTANAIHFGGAKNRVQRVQRVQRRTLCQLSAANDVATRAVVQHLVGCVRIVRGQPQQHPIFDG